jgi:hypothetical protein
LAAAPTNERIAELLEQVLRELDALKQAQESLAVEIRAVTTG